MKDKIKTALEIALEGGLVKKQSVAPVILGLPKSHGGFVAAAMPPGTNPDMVTRSLPVMTEDEIQAMFSQTYDSLDQVT